MNDHRELGQPDQDTVHSTQAPQASDQSEQGVESENSSGSVYHSTPQLVTGEDTVEWTVPVAVMTESDSDQHYSDAVQESDDGSVYSAQENFPAPEEDQNMQAHSSHDQWSPSASNVSVLQKVDTVPATTTKIPLRPILKNSSSTSSLKFQKAIEAAERSLIPVPIRFHDHSPGLYVTKSEPKMGSRSASPDKDVPSSESENITAISVKVSNNDVSLDKYKSDDLLGEPVTFPHDTAEHEVTKEPDEEPIHDAVSTTTEDSDVSTFTLSDVRTHRYESENDQNNKRPGKNPTVAFTEVKFSTQPYDMSDAEDFVVQNDICSDATKSVEQILNVVLETIQMVKLDRLQQEECLPPPQIESLEFVDDPTGRDFDLVAFVAPIIPSGSEENVDVEHSDSVIVDIPANVDRITLEDEYNDDDYVEIEEEPSEKKLSKFKKLKSKLAHKSSNKESSVKKSGSPTKTTLKVRRKPPKSPGSRPSSAKRPTTPPSKTSPIILRPRGSTIPQTKVGSIRASIRQETERMKEDGSISIKKRSNSDITILKRNDSFINLKEGRSSSHSIRDIFQDPTSQATPNPKDIRSPSSPTMKNQKATKEETIEKPAVKLLTAVNQSKLNNMISRYKVQMKKLKNQVSDMNDLQSKTGMTKEQLNMLKSHIVAIAGVLPPDLADIPNVPVLTSTTSSGSSTEFVSSSSSAYEDLQRESLALKAENTRLSSAVTSLTKDIKTLKEDNSSLKESLTAYKKQMLTLQKNYEEKLAQMETLKEEVMKARRLLLTYQRKNESFTKSINEAKVHHEEERSRRVENEKQLTAEIQNLRSRLSMESSRRESILATLGEEKEYLEEQVVSLNGTVQELKQKLIEQESDVNRAKEIRTEYEALKKSFHTIEKELADSKKCCQSLASRIDSSEKSEEETSKKLIELSEEIMNKIRLIEEISEQRTVEENRRKELYKIISDLSAFTGNKIDAAEIQKAADVEKCELTNPILKMFEDLEQTMNSKDAEIDRQKQAVSDLQNLHQEKQSLIEQMYELMNEKNASICQRSESRDAVSDNKEEEKTMERSTNVTTTEAQASLKDHPEFTDLYSMLESKRKTLLRMESQIRRLQEVHAYCGMRRTMQESRIAELETMLAHCLH